jgi:hypothetical protein
MSRWLVALIARLAVFVPEIAALTLVYFHLVVAAVSGVVVVENFATVVVSFVIVSVVALGIPLLSNISLFFFM